MPLKHLQHRVLLTCLGLFLTGVFLSPARPVSTDIEARLQITRSLWTTGSPVTAEPFVGAVKVEGGWTSFYGTGQSLLMIPFDMMGVGVAHLANLTGKVRDYAERLFVYLLFLPLVGTLWWLLSYRLLRQLGVDAELAYSGSLLFFLGTISYVYAFQSSQEEALVGLCLIASLSALLSWEKRGEKSLLFWAGFIAGWATLVRLNFLTSLAPLGAVLWRAHRQRSWKEWGPGVVGFLLPLSLHFVMAYLRFGTPFSTGYDIAGAQGVGGVLWTYPRWDVLLALVLGPGKGLLWLSPVLFLALWGMGQWYRRDPHLCLGVGVSLLASLLVSSAVYNNPDGSEAWGTRYQVHLVPLLALPLWVGWEQLSRVQRQFAKAALGLGVVFNLAAAAYPWSLEYKQFEGDNIRRVGIMSHPTEGQLPKRLRNLVGLGGPRNPETLAFSPNVWAVSYSHKLHSPWPLVLGLGFLLSGVACLRSASRKSLPDPPPREEKRAA